MPNTQENDAKINKEESPNLIKNNYKTKPVQMMMTAEGLWIWIPKNKLVWVDSSIERIQSTKEYILGESLSYIIMEEKRQKINKSRSILKGSFVFKSQISQFVGHVQTKIVKRPHMNIIPKDQMLRSGRSLRSHRLSPNRFNRFGNVK